jgi:hypothetical protein
VLHSEVEVGVVRYAQEHGNRAVGRRFAVCGTNVRRWSGEKEKIKGISKKKCACRGKSTGIHMWKPNYISILRIRRKTTLQYRWNPCSETEKAA